MAAGAQNARSFIERGLACYGQGDLQQALGQWREALRIDPGNPEARKLVAFVEERMGAQTPVPPAPGTREPSPLPPLDDESVWAANEGTSPESDAQTAARLLRAEVAAKEAVGRDGTDRKRRPTLVSTLPELLAPSTLPEDLRRTAAGLPAVPAHIPRPGTPSGGVPERPAADVATRPVGGDQPTPRNLHVLTRAQTPLDVALVQARERGQRLVRQCREALTAAKASAAAAAAEEALEESEKAPAPGIAEVIEPARALLEQAFVAHLGRPSSVPTMAVDDATVNASNFDHRTGFLLSCIDGTLPVDTLMDISGMGRFEALRTLSRLLRRKIIKID